MALHTHARTRINICWGLTIFWFAAFLVSVLQADAPIGKVAAGLQALTLLVFVALHGSLSNGWRGFGAYFVITAVVAFGLEATSIATGFPFGFYTHHMATSVKPFGVPIPVVLGYVILGWLAWSVARLIVRDHPSDSHGLNRFTTPIVASFVLAGYDYTYDAIGATVLGMWSYRNPSGTFGVPLTNFLGWLFTGWVFFQLFALIEARFPAASKANGVLIQPALIWLAIAAQYPIMFVAASAGVTERGGRSFLIADIYEAAVAASLFTLVFTALLAIFRVMTRHPPPADRQG